VLVDDVLVPADLGPFASIAGIYIELNLLAAVIDGADDYLGTWISQRFLTTLRRDAYAHVLALPSHPPRPSAPGRCDESSPLTSVRSSRSWSVT
jgi:hypothetical protein